MSWKTEYPNWGKNGDVWISFLSFIDQTPGFCLLIDSLILLLALLLLIL